MVSRLSMRDAAAAALSAWLLLLTIVLLLLQPLAWPVLFLLLFVALALAAGLLLLGRDLRRGEPPDMVVSLSAPAAMVVLVGILVALGGAFIQGAFLLLLPALGVIALVALEHPASLRETVDRLRDLVVARVPATSPAPAPEVAPKAPKLTPAERAEQFAHDAFALDTTQLETLIAGSSALDKQSRELAWNQIRPALTPSERMALFTGVRDRIGRWVSGAGEEEDAPRADVPSSLRRRAYVPLLDAAAAVIAQDRITKRPFEVLYAPFRTAQSGEPAKVRIAPGVLGPAPARTTPKRVVPGGGDGVAAPAAHAGPRSARPSRPHGGAEKPPGGDASNPPGAPKPSRPRSGEHAPGEGGSRP